MIKLENIQKVFRTEEVETVALRTAWTTWPAPSSPASRT